MLIKTSVTLKEIIALILMMSPPLINYLLNTDPLIRISEIIAEALGLITIHFTVLVSLVSFSIGILICINLDRK
ncbi:MAG: hypothetical protein QXP91_04305 [Candidatus Methanomethylicia archaeon]